MKFSKLFLTVCGVAIAMNMSAQSNTTTTADKPESSLLSNNGDYDHGYHFMPEIKIGGCYGSGGFGANLVLEHEFHKYLAWDIVSIDFSAPFDFEFGNIGLKTGLRAFTRRFWGDKVRGYTSLALGWECTILDNRSLRKALDLPTSKHGLGVSWGIGLQIQKHIFAGYTLEYNTALKNTSHYAKFAYRF